MAPTFVPVVRAVTGEAGGGHLYCEDGDEDDGDVEDEDGVDKGDNDDADDGVNLSGHNTSLALPLVHNPSACA